MLLEVQDLTVGYGPVAVVHDVAFNVEAGRVVALLGSNGAGKSTTLLGVSGALPALSGVVRMGGKVLDGPLFRRVRSGLGLITEDRGVFRQLTTLENLKVADVDPAKVLRWFPSLESRFKVPAGVLSGGEQQMLAVGRALARDTPVLLIDELSLGLAPLVVDVLLAAIRSAADEGRGILLVEQHVRRTLEVADDVYVLERGRMATSGTAVEVKDRLEEIEAAYFSVGNGGDCPN
jgi:branched-chain amino acid transport system ATP-binding protein